MNEIFPGKTCDHHRSIHSARFIVCALVAVVGLVGCAQRPHLQVDKGIDPAYVNKNVRFRTTYYFRVIDMCGSDAQGQDVAIDSLYRFRMSGKAHPGLAKVKFESGTLTAQQIDPFGAEIAFDEETQTHKFLSTKESKAKSLRRSLLSHIKTLNTLKFDPKDVAAIESRDAIKALIEEDIASYSSGQASNGAQEQYGVAVSLLQNAKVFRTGELTRLRLRTKEIQDNLDLLSEFRVDVDSLKSMQTEMETLTEEHEIAVHRARIERQRRHLSRAFQKLSTRLTVLQSHTSRAVWGAAEKLPELVGRIGKSLATPKWDVPSENTKREGWLATIDGLLAETGSTNLQSWLPNLIENLPEQTWLNEAESIVTSLSTAASNNPNVLSGSAQSGLSCGEAARGFQILGPEGWRTFNQDERLLLAMTTSAKPLIQSMQALSQRIEDSRGLDSRDVDVALATSRSAISEFSAELEAAAGQQYGSDLAQVEALRILLDEQITVEESSNSEVR